jgi:hypothetical protein
MTKFQRLSLSFALMTLPVVGLYYAAQAEIVWLVWGLLATVMSGALIAVFTR